MSLTPAVIICTANTWVKVASAVNGGVIHKLSSAPDLYRQTYRREDDSAPSNDVDAMLLFSADLSELISSDTPIDIYVKALGRDGSVRVDL